MGDELVEVGVQLFHGRAVALFERRVIGHKAAAERNALGVFGHYLSVGILFFQLGYGSVHRVERRAHLVRERYVIDVLAAREHGLEVLGVGKLVQRRGFGNGARAHLVEKCLEVCLFAHVVKVFLVADGIGHAYYVQPEFGNRGIPQFAVRIAE